jgi:ectoine hydroxylase-related dioxygenase (phytanoyl-CoA dioxygenase family)
MTPAQQYQQDGFYIASDPVIPTNVVDAAVKGMDAIRAGEYDTGHPPENSPWNPGDDPKTLCKIEMPQLASHAIMNLISHSALGQLAAEVTGAKMIQVWWVQLLYKPVGEPEGERITNIGWHQDRHYWRIWEEGSELFTAWVALSDITPDAGPMRLIPGSHRWGLLEIDRGFQKQDLDILRHNITIPEHETWNEVPVLISPGALSLHDSFTLHGSGPNRCNGPRRSFAIHMRTEKSRPVNDKREGLARYIGDLSKCPVIYGQL